MIVTTLEQSKHLLELGIDPKTADIVWVYSAFENEYFPHIKGFGKIITGSKDIPAWSLLALLELIPYPMLSLQFDQTWYCAGFIDSGIVLVDKCTTPIDAAFQLVIKLKS